MSQTATKSSDLPHVDKVVQLSHARELFSSESYRPALVTQRSGDLREFIYTVVHRSLSPKQRHHAFAIAGTVINEANRHKMDPLFVLAVIATESSFDIKARGRHGEIGLMQILPKTAKWLAPRMNLCKEFDLEDPVTNIRIGVSYFAKLRRNFRHNVNRYVGAYNMGSANVRRLVASKVEPREYSGRVIQNYTQFYLSLPGGLSTESARDVASSAQIPFPNLNTAHAPLTSREVL